MPSMKHPIIFGIRHLSPAGAWHLIRLLEKVRPQLVLVEGPCDFNALLPDIAATNTIPPIAILAYTKEMPIRTILYPFSAYSPEYQAILWASHNDAICRFIDLPSGVFVSLQGSGLDLGQNDNTMDASSIVYQKLNELSGEGSHETFWERTIEHSVLEDVYLTGAGEFGRQIRELTEGLDQDYAEILIREAFMKKQIEAAIREGFDPEKIVVVTGAYHVSGLLSGSLAMTSEEEAALPSMETDITLMPYSYYRLSTRSGYGAGNKAPAYYELLWNALNANEPGQAVYFYLSQIAAYSRKYGNMTSSAEVIEAVRLSAAMANLHGCHTPALADLRDAAVTCMGHGNFSELALAIASVEIGTKIGSLPEGVSRTSIQSDFYRRLKELRLEKYKSMVSEDLSLDLREKLSVKSQKSAFLDLERSFFLHRLRVLQISFVSKQTMNQDKATWAEAWILRWTPEAEIELVESALKGDTVAQAASFAMKERVEQESNISAAASVIEDAFFCGLPESVNYATVVLQKLTVDAAAINEIAATAGNLSLVIRYGSIRRLDPEPLKPILEQLFFRACLLLPESCICDNQSVSAVIQALDTLNEVSLHMDFLEEELWIRVLSELSRRDDLNTKASGFAAAILLERGKIDSEQLAAEVQRRLSKGIPADLGAGWFTGLSMKNRFALVARLSLWEKLDEYLVTLDDEEFKRSLVFLRRAFADFSSKEKSDIAENLGEIWKLNPDEVSEVLNKPVTQDEQKMFESLDDFDFGDI